MMTRSMSLLKTNVTRYTRKTFVYSMPTSVILLCYFNSYICLFIAQLQKPQPQYSLIAKHFLESCKGGIGNSGSSDRVLHKYKKVLELKEKEIQYLRNHVSSLDTRRHVPGLPTIYIITPTYSRLVQVRPLTQFVKLNSIKPSSKPKCHAVIYHFNHRNIVEIEDMRRSGNC